MLQLHDFLEVCVPQSCNQYEATFLRNDWFGKHVLVLHHGSSFHLIQTNVTYIITITLRFRFRVNKVQLGDSSWHNYHTTAGWPACSCITARSCSSISFAAGLRKRLRPFFVRSASSASSAERAALSFSFCSAFFLLFSAFAAARSCSFFSLSASFCVALSSSCRAFLAALRCAVQSVAAVILGFCEWLSPNDCLTDRPKKN